MQQIKCISLTQPYATLAGIGAKLNETRSWRTWYRGPLAIHAAKGFPRWAQQLCTQEPFWWALNKAGISDTRNLPRGAIIATVNLTDCLRIVDGGMRYTSDPASVIPVPEPELSFGDYTPGRWAWRLEDALMLPEPIPWRGQLGLFDVDIPDFVEVTP